MSEIIVHSRTARGELSKCPNYDGCKTNNGRMEDQCRWNKNGYYSYLITHLSV